MLKMLMVIRVADLKLEQSHRILPYSYFSFCLIVRSPKSKQCVLFWVSSEMYGMGRKFVILVLCPFKISWWVLYEMIEAGAV